MDLKLKIKKTIEEKSLISPGDFVLLGLSGGPDSMCLLHLLADLRKDLDFQLYALHVNHCIRGAEADGDEEFLRSYMPALGIPCSFVRADVPALAKELHLTPEEAGRKVRKEAFIKRLGEIKAENPGKNGGLKLALAHNSGDQAETVLMRILRGTGVRGLCGMEYRGSLCTDPQAIIIRPLLGTCRPEIEEYCSSRGLEPRIDSTNLKADYTRNRLRLELLPLLSRDYNPSVAEALLRLSENAAEDEAALKAISEETMAKICSFRYDEHTGKPVEAAMPVRELQKLQPAILKRIVVEAFGRLGLTEGIGSVHLNALAASVEKNYGGKLTEFPRGHRALISGGKLILK